MKVLLSSQVFSIEMDYDELMAIFKITGALSGAKEKDMGLTDEQCAASNRVYDTLSEFFEKGEWKWKL
jgi:hypothetical protein